MRSETEKNAAEESIGLKDNKITRKEALKKSGYIAISVATTLILLGSPNNAQAGSEAAAPPTW